VPLPAVEVSQSPEEKFREYLASRAEPRRFTPQQRDLVRRIFARHEHFDAAQLLEILKNEGLAISRATVYRTLAELVDAGLLRKIEIGARTVFDHDYGYPWHEHFVCDACGSIIEFQQAGIEAAVKLAAAAHGFKPDAYTLVVRGVCSSCNAAQAASRRRYVV
jgi:Fur family transcriptional regulator, ferric uptake regulator